MQGFFKEGKQISRTFFVKTINCEPLIFVLKHLCWYDYRAVSTASPTSTVVHYCAVLLADFHFSSPPNNLIVVISFKIN